MPTVLSLSYLDYGNERATVQGNIPIITAGNFASIATLINNLVAAADDIVLGTLAGRLMSIVTPGSGATPVDVEAQREVKWRIKYRDNTANLAAGVTNPYFGRTFGNTLPTAELTGHLAANSDFADLANADIVAFVNAYNAFQRSPSGGVAVVTSIEHVGRNI